MLPHSIVLLDTNVLLQLLLTKHGSLLKKLKTEYGLSSAIVPASARPRWRP